MLAAVTGIPFGYVLCGIILAITFGLAVGNYACSLVHRLPRGKLLLDKTPYCGSCGKLLSVKDLFPVISAVMLKHRCRYCGTAFPTSHTWTEALTALLFVLTFLQHGFTEQFLLIAFIGVFLITLAAIEANDHMIMRKMLICVAISGALYRVLIDHTIYDAFAGAFFGGLIGTIIMYRHIQKVGHVYVLPPLAQLMAVGGLCVGLRQLPLFLALFAGVYLVGKLLKWPVTVTFSIAVIVPVMYPNFILL